MSSPRNGGALGIALLFLAVLPAWAGTDVRTTRAEIEAAFGFVPAVFQVLPEDAQPGAWEALRDLELNPDTALPSKEKALIGIAVAAQIPCAYCLYLDTETARMAGASDLEIREALGMAAITRHWSTVLNGMRLDRDEFHRDVRGILDHVAANMNADPPPAMPVTDAASAYRDMEANLGLVPGFFRAYPRSAIAGAWKEFKGLQMNPDTQLPGKTKELIGLAVASQIPCEYCVEAHTEFATFMGATPDEIADAVGMAALVRHWSTLLNGSQQEIGDFRAEADRMLRFATQQASAGH
jgi:AhpD family alkylhydroperoxidase